MAIEVTLQNPNNASNPVALEAVIAENNAAIAEAFLKVLSREESETNFMLVDLDLNGNNLLNVGDSPFIKKSDVGAIEVGEVRRNPTTDDLEYRASGAGTYTTLYSKAELQGVPGTDGAGIGDLIATNNLSDLANIATARINLGLRIGVDVQPYDANLIGFNPDSKADENDPRFDRFSLRSFSANANMGVWGRLYRNASASTRVVTVQVGEVGCVNAIYSPPDRGPISIVADTGVSIYIAGQTTPSPTLTVAPGGYASITCFSDDGLSFVISGTGLS